MVDRLGALNERIRSDGDLGRGFCVGHSFFTPPPDGGLGSDHDLDGAWYERVVRTEVAPLLREYWFDRPDAAASAVDALLA